MEINNARVRWQERLEFTLANKNNKTFLEEKKEISNFRRMLVM